MLEDDVSAPDSPTASTVMTHATTSSGTSANTITLASSRLPNPPVLDSAPIRRRSLRRRKSRLGRWLEGDDDLEGGASCSSGANAHYLAYPDLNPGRALSEDKSDDDLADYVLVEDDPFGLQTTLRRPRQSYSEDIPRPSSSRTHT